MKTLNPEIMQKLSQPFDAGAVKFKPGATTKDKTKALARAYATTRTYVERLNSTVGANWSDDFSLSDGGSVVLCRRPIGV